MGCVVLLCVLIHSVYSTTYPPHALDPMVCGMVCGMVWYVCASGVVTRTPGGTVCIHLSPVSSSTPHTLYTLVWCHVWSVGPTMPSVGPT
jgi:hypothetical protein